MIPDKKAALQLLRKYAPNDEYFELVSTHGMIVAEIALFCANNTSDNVDLEVLESACLLHDIGSYVFVGAENYSSDFKNNYPGHAIFGAKILQDEGLDERIWRAVETHVLLGLSMQEISSSGMALPEKDYFPATIEARLVCYGDRFHSKKPIFNSYDTFLRNLEGAFPLQAAKMKDWAIEFGIPDIESLAKKYNHPIK